MLSAQVREGLEAEIQHLTYERQRVDDKIKAIQAVLAADEPFPSQRSLPMASAGPTTGPLAGMGLREAMKTVLIAHPGGLQTSELVTKLEEGGYRVTGALPLSTRVYAEAARLWKKEGKTTRTKGKTRRWKWVNETQPESQEETG